MYEEKSLSQVTLVARTTTVDEMHQVGEVVGPMFGELAGQLAGLQQRPGHPAVAWYAADGEGLLVGAGFPVGGSAESSAHSAGAAVVPEGAQVVELPAVPKALTTVYRGAMTGIGEAWGQLGEEVRSRGLEFAGPSREIYHTTDGPQEGWVTELQQPVA